jgi:hypothetical protein
MLEQHLREIAREEAYKALKEFQQSLIQSIRSVSSSTDPAVAPAPKRRGRPPGIKMSEETRQKLMEARTRLQSESEA